VLAHSNQALNDIFEKIRNMDSVEERHLLRLGMGGDKVFGKDKDFSFGRMGRVNYLLKRRLDLLEKAKVFANSLGYLEE
jgi:intron-binding protein aquarius